MKQYQTKQDNETSRQACCSCANFSLVFLAPFPANVPQMLYWIKVRGLTWPIHHRYSIIAELFLNQLGRVFRIVILLKDNAPFPKHLLSVGIHGVLHDIDIEMLIHGSFDSTERAHSFG